MFRFTIRELVVVTLAVGIGLGWWLDRQKLQRELQAARQAHKAAVASRDDFMFLFDQLTAEVRRMDYAPAYTLLGGGPRLNQVELIDESPKRQAAFPYSRRGD